MQVQRRTVNGRTVYYVSDNLYIKMLTIKNGVVFDDNKEVHRANDNRAALAWARQQITSTEQARKAAQ